MSGNLVRMIVVMAGLAGVMYWLKGAVGLYIVLGCAGFAAVFALTVGFLRRNRPPLDLDEMERQMVAADKSKDELLFMDLESKLGLEGQLRSGVNLSGHAVIATLILEHAQRAVDSMARAHAVTVLRDMRYFQPTAVAAIRAVVATDADPYVKSCANAFLAASTAASP